MAPASSAYDGGQEGELYDSTAPCRPWAGRPTPIRTARRQSDACCGPDTSTPSSTSSASPSRGACSPPTGRLRRLLPDRPPGRRDGPRTPPASRRMGGLVGIASLDRPPPLATASAGRRPDGLRGAQHAALSVERLHRQVRAAAVPGSAMAVSKPPRGSARERLQSLRGRRRPAPSSSPPRWPRSSSRRRPGRRGRSAAPPPPAGRRLGAPRQHVGAIALPPRGQVGVEQQAARRVPPPTVARLAPADHPVTVFERLHVALAVGHQRRRVREDRTSVAVPVGGVERDFDRPRGRVHAGRGAVVEERDRPVGLFAGVVLPGGGARPAPSLKLSCLPPSSHRTWPLWGRRRRRPRCCGRPPGSCRRGTRPRR